MSLSTLAIINSVISILHETDAASTGSMGKLLGDKAELILVEITGGSLTASNQPGYDVVGPAFVSELPQGIDFEYILGVDLGYEDPFAMSVIAYSTDHPVAYLVHSEHYKHQTPTQWAEHIKRVQKQYNVWETVVDAGALGKAIVEDLNARFDLGLNPANKQEKMGNIELMNGEFVAERLMILPGNDELTSQARILSKDKTGKKEDPTLQNDLLDSLLYSWKHARNYMYIEPELQPEFGSDEYNEMIDREQEESLAEHFESDKSIFDNDDVGEFVA